MQAKKRESRTMSKARKSARMRGFNDAQAKLWVNTLKNKYHILLQPVDWKFFLTVNNWYLDCSIEEASTTENSFMRMLQLLVQSHANEYDDNFNGLSVAQLLYRFATDVQETTDGERIRIVNKQYSQSEYTIVPIRSSKEAQAYTNHVAWCITGSAYDNYTHNAKGMFYFMLKNGYENLSPTVGKDAPCDEYGMSMIAVGVGMTGELTSATCRWNHKNGGNDRMFTVEQLSDLAGGSFYEIFKPRFTKDELERQIFANGTKSDKFRSIVYDGLYFLLDSEGRLISDKYGHFKFYLSDIKENNGLYIICTDYHKRGVVDRNNNEIIPLKYDNIQFADNGLFWICINNKWSLFDINANANISTKQYHTPFPLGEVFVQVRLNDKQGLVDGNDNIIAPIKYDDIQLSSRDTIIQVKLNNKWGLIDTKGNKIAPVKYDEIRNAYYYIRRYIMLNDKWGMIDKNGNETVPIKYDEIKCISHHNSGFAYVRLNDKWGIIDVNDNEFVPLKYNKIESCENFHRVSLNDKWGLIDVNDNEIIPLKYNKIEGFAKDLVKVKLRYKWGIIATDGTKISPAKYNKIGDFYTNYSNGDNWFVAVELKGKWGLIDMNGNETVPSIYDEIESVFYHGDSKFAHVRLNGKCGIVDMNGNVTVPIKYDEIKSISYHGDSEFAYVRLNGKWGIIDINGNETVPTKYDKIGADRSDGHFHRIRLNDKWGIIDVNDNVIVPAIYDKIEGFTVDLDKVKLNDKWGLVDIKSKKSIPPVYDVIEYLYGSGGYWGYSVKLNDKWGAFDYSGNEIVPLKYDNILQFQERVIRVSLNGKWGIVGDHDKEIIPLEYDRIDIAMYDSDYAQIALLELNGKWGFCATTGYTMATGYKLTPPEYDEIKVSNSGRNEFIHVKLNGKWGVFDYYGNEIIPAKYSEINECYITSLL